VTPEVVVRALVEAYNRKSLTDVLAYYRADAFYWDPLHREGVRGRKAIADVLGELFEAFPDEHMAVETLAADETHTVAEFRSTGTTRDGRPFELEFTEVYEVVEGEIASCHVYLDPERLPL
jgi:ketosteroid isomerase-like protein